MDKLKTLQWNNDEDDMKYDIGEKISIDKII